MDEEGSEGVNVGAAASAESADQRGEKRKDDSSASGGQAENSKKVKADGAPSTISATREIKPDGGTNEPRLFIIENSEIRIATGRRTPHTYEAQRAKAYQMRLEQCCRGNNDMLLARKIYKKAQELDIKMEHRTLSMLLAICGGKLTTKRQTESEEDGDNGGGGGGGAASGAATADESGAAGGNGEANGNGTESGICAGPEKEGGGAVAQGAAAQEHPGSAELNPSAAAEFACEVMEALKKVLPRGQTQPPESALSTLIRVYCKDGQVDNAMRVLDEMTTAKQTLRLRTFSPLLTGFSAKGDLSTCMALWERAKANKVELSDKEYSYLVQACTAAEDAPAFEKVAKEFLEDVLQPQSRDTWSALAAFFRSNAGAKLLGDGGVWEVSENCQISDLGECSCCEATLQSIELDQEARNTLMTQIEGLATTNDDQVKQWAGFKGYLDRKGRGAFDIIIDGANVGYYKQAAHDKARGNQLADLRQIDGVAEQLAAKGKRVCVMLHTRHVSFYHLDPSFAAIVHKWREAHMLMTCPPRNNDDFYWLYAAMWLGSDVQVLSNDELRDHHFNMLNSRLFNRWRERRQVRFCFLEELNGTYRPNGPKTLVMLAPSIYSKRMQHGADTWHFPLAKSTEWMCVRKAAAKEAASS